jgi:hypothetical protein
MGHRDLVRNALLPKQMSGEARVPETTKEMEAVT